MSVCMIGSVSLLRGLHIGTRDFMGEQYTLYMHEESSEISVQCLYHLSALGQP